MGTRMRIQFPGIFEKAKRENSKRVFKETSELSILTTAFCSDGQLGPVENFLSPEPIYFLLFHRMK